MASVQAMRGAATSSSAFAEKKKRILDQLAVPGTEYSDASPKGSVDEGIRDLIDEINRVDGFVTTSSCAGRVSVFLEGRRVAEADDDGQVAGVGGKGAGGTWLYVSHDPVPDSTNGEQDWAQVLGLSGTSMSSASDTTSVKERRLIHFKFEAMILHILTASPEQAQVILRCALQAGFRESGAVNITSQGNDSSAAPMVAVRTMGLAFESLVGEQVDGQNQLFVPPSYLRTLVEIANERFAENTKRIERFQTAFRQAISPPAPKLNPEGQEWEDVAARRERKRAEGLRRKAELQEAKASAPVSNGDAVELGNEQDVPLLRL